MLQRAQNELRGSSAEGLQVSTFHAYCNNLLISAEGATSMCWMDKQLWVFLRKNISRIEAEPFRSCRKCCQVSRRPDWSSCAAARMNWSGQSNMRNMCAGLNAARSRYPGLANLKTRTGFQMKRRSAVAAKSLRFLKPSNACCGSAILGTFGHMILRANELLAEDAAVAGRKSEPGRGSFWSMNFRMRTLPRSRCWKNWWGR